MADSEFTTDGTLNTTFKPAQESGVSTEQVLDNTALSAQGAEARAIAQAPIDHAFKAQNTPLSDKIGAVVNNWDTTHIIQAFSADMQRLDDVDPNFVPSAHIGNIMNLYGLEPTEGNIKELSKSSSQHDMASTAQTLREHQDSQQVLADHGAVAFAGGLLDPVWLAMDVGTLGASSALKAGRVGSAAFGAAGAVGITAASNRMGNDFHAQDYLLNAALVGGMNLILGGNKAAKAVESPTPVGDPIPLKGAEADKIRGEGLNPSGPSVGFSFDSPLQKVNSFTTEFDSMTPNPESVAFSAKVMDDPIGRTGAVQENSAASLMRVWKNRAEGLMANYNDHVDDVLKEQGHGFFSRTLDWNGSARAARDDFQNSVYADIIRRDNEFSRYGTVTKNADPRIAKGVEHVENLNNSMAEMARDAGVSGFEDFTPRPGYIHRAWNPDAAVGAMKRYGKDTVHQLFEKSILQTAKDIPHEDAKVIADAFVTRLKAMHQNERVDFRGSLGNMDTGAIREMLENTAGVPQARIDSIMNRLNQRVDKKSKIKFAKTRMALDMTADVTTPEGTKLSMLDLVHKDIDRISENYAHQMVGRSALAAAGVGATDSEIRNFSAKWANAIVGPNGTKAELSVVQKKIQGIMGDFTGNRPESYQLSAALSTISSLTSMTVLSSSGMWQLGEYGTIAFKHGFSNTVDAFLRYAPGLKKILSKARKDPSIVQEFNDVANFQLTRDVQFKPWLRQIELNETAKDTRWQRALHYGKQAIPYINGMKYIQGHQAQMVAELAVQNLVKAARGDAAALKRLAPHNISKETLQRISENVNSFGKFESKRCVRLGLGAWPAEDVERLTQAAGRLMDASLLMARTGEGAHWMRTAPGQVLGMFRSFVAYSHNKQLRSIYNHQGVLGLAHIMAYQYPLMYMSMYLNDIRKHPKGDGDDASALALKTFGMLGTMGFLGDAAGILGLTGGQGGLSTPVFGAFNNIKGIADAGKAVAEGDFSGGAWKAGKALTMSTPVLAAFPATATLVESLKPDDTK